MPSDVHDLDEVPKEILEECAQITKWNSIEGSKRGSVKIVYTYSTNLKKDKTMATGEVAFFDESKCRYMNVSTNKKLAKTLLKSKHEEYPNLQSTFPECNHAFRRDARGQNAGPRQGG